MEIAWAAEFTDLCSPTLLADIGAPAAAATTQLSAELANISITPLSVQNMTRIWSSFHFLPYDLYAKKAGRSRQYMNKYRLICKPNGYLVTETVELAKKNGSMQAIGIAAHVLADTWAHSFFAGTPSLVINNITEHVYEQRDGEETKISFRHTLGAQDDIKRNSFTATFYQTRESSIMNLGHGRAGHLPDYSFLRYRYLPAWAEYEEVVKDNPSDYMHAIAQTVYALRYIRGDFESFELGKYEDERLGPWKDDIRSLLEKRQIDTVNEWHELAERISGHTVEDFSFSEFRKQYLDTPESARDLSVLGKFFIASMAQKSMVTNKIFRSGSLLAGFSVEYRLFGFRGIADYKKLVKHWKGG